MSSSMNTQGGSQSSRKRRRSPTQTIEYRGTCYVSSDGKLHIDPTFWVGTKDSQDGVEVGSQYLARPEVLSQALIEAYEVAPRGGPLLATALQESMKRRAVDISVVMSEGEYDRDKSVASTVWNQRMNMTTQEWIFDPSYPEPQFEYIEEHFGSHYQVSESDQDSEPPVAAGEDQDEGYSEE